MADEQPVPIYLSPDEDLTSVRERLERSQARQIILVIPPQTQLRSHVGWRLIHARMREMGKDLLVVSPDRQVRAVARAAGFRVAETQESSTSRPRTGSGGTRPGTPGSRSGAGSPRSRPISNRGASPSRSLQSRGGERRQTPNSVPRPLTPLPSEPDIYDDDDITLSRPGQPAAEENQQSSSPALLQTPKRSFNDFQISTTPSVHPSVPGHIEEDDDDVEINNYYADYHTAQHIRESASGGGAGDRSEPGQGDLFQEHEEARGSHGSTSKRWNTDLFSYMEEEEPQLPLPEQRGSMPGLFDEIGTNVPDISDRSTEIMESEIEDLGDLGAITPPSITSLPRPPEREQDARPKRPSGPTRQHSPRSPRPASPGYDDDDELLALPDRPTQGSRSSRSLTGSQRPSQTLRPAATTQRPSQTLRPAQPQGQPARQAQRPSQTLRPAQPQAQPARQAQRPSQTLRPAQPQPAAQRGRTGGFGSRAPILAPQASVPVRARRNRRSNRVPAAIFTVIVLLLIVAGLLLYFVPTATVTISLQAQSYSQNFQLTASGNPAPGTANTLQAETMTYTTPVSGQRSASGQTKIGDVKAQGSVTFTNNGSTDVIIPTGTVITTASGILFTTQAEAFVSHGGGSYPVVPISAQQAGVAGNVAAHTITILPADSLSKIATYNHVSAQALSLTVTNPQPTSQGGARTVPAATQQDILALKNMLHKQLQQQLTAWLTAQTKQGDFHGTPVPDVLKSATPLTAEQFSGLPSVGQAEESGTFSGTLSVQIKVLFARADALNSAVRAALNSTLQKASPQTLVLTQLPITLQNTKSVAASDGTSLTISGKALAAAMKPLNTQDLSSSLAGKSFDQASSDLRASLAQSGIKDVQITESPSFLSFMPLRADRIQVILQPLPLVLNNSPKG